MASAARPSTRRAIDERPVELHGSPPSSAFTLSAVLGLAVTAQAQKHRADRGGGGKPLLGCAEQRGRQSRRGQCAEGPTLPAGAPNGLDWVQQQGRPLAPAAQDHCGAGAGTGTEPSLKSMRANARDLEQLYQDRSEHYENMSAVDNLKNYQEIIQAQAEDLSKKGQPSKGPGRCLVAGAEAVRRSDLPLSGRTSWSSGT